jgi:hypothetical protein
VAPLGPLQGPRLAAAERPTRDTLGRVKRSLAASVRMVGSGFTDAGSALPSIRTHSCVLLRLGRCVRDQRLRICHEIRFSLAIRFPCLLRTGLYVLIRAWDRTMHHRKQRLRGCARHIALSFATAVDAGRSYLDFHSDCNSSPCRCTRHSPVTLSFSTQTSMLGRRCGRPRYSLRTMFLISTLTSSRRATR